jgi:CSLREA domain-containing protein
MQKTVNLTILALLVGCLTPAFATTAPMLQVVSLTPAGAGSDELLPQGLRARSMSSGDFDEDGVPDLVVSYSGDGSRFMVLYRGNLDSIFPFSAAARQRAKAGVFHAAPFHPDPTVVPVNVTFDFLATGDFDADGHLDLVGANPGDTTLEFFRGNGRGEFLRQGPIHLDGAVTTLGVAEVNRRDGLADLVVGIQSGPVAELLVFEGPNGALVSDPERFAIPSQALAVAMGELDGLSGLDIAVAAGSELILIHGRDRKLSLDRARRDFVEPAFVDRHSMGSTITGLAFGNFFLDASGQRELAVYSNSGRVEILQGETAWIAMPDKDGAPGKDRPRTTWKQIEDVDVGAALAVDFRPQLTPVRSAGSVDVALTGIPGTAVSLVRTGRATTSVAEIDIGQSMAAVVPMRLNPDGLTDLVMIPEGEGEPIVLVSAPQATITVDSTGDNTTGGDGNCTLREAVINANSNSDTTSGDCVAGAAGADMIDFNIAGGGQETIGMADGLPEITDPLTINGNTQCGSPPCIELAGSAVPDPGADDLNAITITAGSSVIRGLVVTDWPDDGLQTQGLAGGGFIEGNFFGLQFDGSTADGNTNQNIQLFSPDNIVGGTAATASNLSSSSIAGGALQIINLDPADLITDASGNTVAGNYLGTDITGAQDRGNTQAGVYVLEASGNTIGGTVPGSQNVISNNGVGVLIRESDLAAFSAENNLVQRNLIGTDVNGTSGFGNDGDGAWIWFASNNTVGGTAAAARNIISDNGGYGVLVTNNSTGLTPTEDNLVQGNYIGVDINGTSDLGNSDIGVVVSASDDNTIGGTATGAGNIISGNASLGVYVGTFDTLGADGNAVQGNLIGTNATGTAGIGNDSTGVYLGGATNTLIGGSEVGAGNLISGSTIHGIHVQNAANTNTIQGNFIGTNLAGNAALPNGGIGILISDGSTGNLVGGGGSGPLGSSAPEGGGIVPPGNLVSGNVQDGVAFFSSSPNNTVRGNFIGTDALGTGAIPNGFSGINAFSSGGQIIGGTGSGEGNLISGNTNSGIFLGESSNGNVVKNNYIGVGVDGTTVVANGGTGVTVVGSSSNQIGAVGAGNRIASNAANGVYLASTGNDDNQIIGNELSSNGNAGIVTDADAGTGNTFSQNSISGNGGFGIDLGADGLTPNDNLDPDTGANNLQNFPVLTAASSGSTQVTGMFNSLANTQFTLEFFSSPTCDGSAFGEGETYLGSIQVNTNGIGDAAIDTVLAATTPVGHVVTSTATAPDGSTSEFSQCVVVSAGDFEIFLDGFEDGTTDAWSVTVP